MLFQRGTMAAPTLLGSGRRAMDRHVGTLSSGNGADAQQPHGLAVESLPVRCALIVDDEALIAMAIAEYCCDLGVEALAVFDPIEALDVLGRHPEIEALVTDVRMPGMNGPELVRRARVGRPDLAVLFITGFAAEADLADAGDWPVLYKPFDLGALGPALQRALDLR